MAFFVRRLEKVKSVEDLVKIKICSSCPRLSIAWMIKRALKQSNYMTIEHILIVTQVSPHSSGFQKYSLLVVDQASKLAVVELESSSLAV